jgi:CHAD domain-containing protein
MKSNHILIDIHGHFKKLKRSYNSLVHDFDNDVIHDFRLEIKKLQAFIQLINTGTDVHVKLKGSLKHFYNSIGEIRNLQLHRQHVTSLCNGLYLEIPVLYLKQVKQEEIRCQKIAVGLLKKHAFKRLEKHLVNSSSGKVLHKSRSDFVDESRTAILHFIPIASVNEEALHEIRKVLKRFMYNQVYIGSEEFLLLPGMSTEQKSAASLALMLGNFHDLCISLAYLETFSKAHAQHTREQHVLNILKAEWEVRKNELKQESLRALDYLSTATV